MYLAKLFKLFKVSYLYKKKLQFLIFNMNQTSNLFDGLLIKLIIKNLVK